MNRLFRCGAISRNSLEPRSRRSTRSLTTRRFASSLALLGLFGCGGSPAGETTSEDPTTNVGSPLCRQGTVCLQCGRGQVLNADGQSCIAATPPPPAGGTVAFTSVTPMQPGWVRMLASYTVTSPSSVYPPTFAMTAACAPGLFSTTDPAATTFTIVDQGDGVLQIDWRANVDWIVNNGLPHPCDADALTLTLTNQTFTTTATAKSIRMDAPIAATGHVWPQGTAWQDHDWTSQPVALNGPRRWVAYPPTVFAVWTHAGHQAFVEVEELPTRKSLALRHVSTTEGWGADPHPDFEIGAGAEIFDGWGVDVEVRGVAREQTAAESARWAAPTSSTQSFGATWTPPTHASTGDISNLGSMGDRSGSILGAPPLFATESQYEQHELLNYGIPRVRSDQYQLDFTYDFASHSIIPAHGAIIQTLENVDGIPATPAPVSRVAGVVASVPAAHGTGVTPKAGTCIASAQAVPIILLPSSIPDLNAKTGPGDLSIVADAMTPYPAGRDNLHADDCGSITLMQNEEAILNRFSNDLGTTRIATVGTTSIPIADPRITLSVDAQVWELMSGLGTADDHALTALAMSGPPEPYAWSGNSLLMPAFAQGFWPHPDAMFPDYVTPLVLTFASDPFGSKPLSACAEALGGEWNAASCIPQGQPPSGIYWSYSRMIANATAPSTQDPLQDGVVSLAQSYMPFVETNHIDVAGRGHFVPASSLGGLNWLPSAQMDASSAILFAIRELQTHRLPMELDYDFGLTNGATGGWQLPSSITAASEFFYIPRELGTCDYSSWARSKGHVASIVGYHVEGTDAPGGWDPYDSYFILENNWGKYAGDGHGYFAINFAAFQQMATALHTYRLDRRCASEACARH